MNHVSRPLSHIISKCIKTESAAVGPSLGNSALRAFLVNFSSPGEQNVPTPCCCPRVNGGSCTSSNWVGTAAKHKEHVCCWREHGGAPDGSGTCIWAPFEHFGVAAFGFVTQGCCDQASWKCCPPYWFLLRRSSLLRTPLFFTGKMLSIGLAKKFIRFFPIRWLQ